MLIEEVRNWIKRWLFRDELVQLQLLKDKVSKYETTIKVQATQIERQKNKITQLSSELDKYTDSKYEAPKFLNQVESAYSPKVRIVDSDGNTNEVRIDQRDFYTPTPTLERTYKNLNLNGKSHDEKLREIHFYVVNWLNYVMDNGEDWRFPQVTNTIRKGDCEDGTILFVTLCRIAGIPPTKVFNATGLLDLGDASIGHSFPIAQMEDGKWYIFETTLNNYRKEELFKGSNYHASWGLSNWLFSGKLKVGSQI